MINSELEFTIGNTDLRITKEGKIQVRARSGTALVKQKGVASVTTTSTSWVDTGESVDILQTALGKKESASIAKALPILKKNRNFFKKLRENFPLEIKSLDLDFGFFKVKFTRKKKSTK